MHPPYSLCLLTNVIPFSPNPSDAVNVKRKSQRGHKRRSLHVKGLPRLRLRKQHLPRRRERLQRKRKWRVKARKKTMRIWMIPWETKHLPNHWLGSVCRREILLRRGNSSKSRLHWPRFVRYVYIYLASTFPYACYTQDSHNLFHLIY